MFYGVAKFFGYLVTLPNAAVFLVLLATASLWTRFRRASRMLVTLCVLLLAACAFSPFASIVLRPLEERFPMPAMTDPPTGLIVLGGMTDEVLSAARNTVVLTEAAERLTEAVALSRRFPMMRMVFSGGSGHVEQTQVTEAAVAQRFWTEMGVAADRVTLEDRSRDTWENGVFTKALVQPKPGERWLLVTSASHMPRSVGVFRQLDFPVIPYPVDYRTAGNGSDFKGLRNAADSFAMLAIASHEWIGLIAYRLAGKTSALFPGPN